MTPLLALSASPSDAGRYGRYQALTQRIALSTSVALCCDEPLTQVPVHLAHVPDYLIPPSLRAAAEAAGEIVPVPCIPFTTVMITLMCLLNALGYPPRICNATTPN